MPRFILIVYSESSRGIERRFCIDIFVKCGDIFRSSESQVEFKDSTCKTHRELAPFPNSEVDPPRKRDGQRK
jgi:hypothetical protein